MLTDGLEWCGLLVDYCDVFISCLDSHSDGTHFIHFLNESVGLLTHFITTKTHLQNILTILRLTVSLPLSHKISYGTHS